MALNRKPNLRATPTYRLELGCALVAVRRLEVLVHADVRLPSDLVARLRIGNALDHSALQQHEHTQEDMVQLQCCCFNASRSTHSGRGGDDFVRKQVDIETNVLTHVLENTDDLQRKNVLNSSRNNL